ncbi:TetR/AcrR family transcriptional regulator [Luethyella okanaganae]|uniref:TetR/AcrR family transcriptional regulator n=1 Tax=Luethyella okanaganae TaxID=69372 RepID=A0ABW1VCF6_9MICO
MAKLSDDAKAERRDAIVTAATVRFASQGFHATSMAEVISDSGLAAGTVYKYFASKDDLIVATAERALNGIGAAVASLVGRESIPSPSEFLDAVRASLPSDPSGTLRAHLVLHSWAETSRNPQLAELVCDRYEKLMAAVGPLINVWQERGELPHDRDSAESGRLLLALIQGQIVQAAIFGSRQQH